jgi:hypothetical protein
MAGSTVLYSAYGRGAVCFGWWLPGVILIVGGAPTGAILRRIIAERAMVRRMRERGARKI